MDEELSELWNKFSLTEEERYEIVITDQDIETNMERGKLCLVGKVIADKKINKDAFKNMLVKVWKSCPGPKIIEVGENLYVFEFQTEKIGGRIGSTIGRVIEVEADSDGNCWGKWIRVKVEMDLLKPLIRGKIVELLGQKNFIQFKYERLPRFCFKCGVIKHGVQGCVGMYNQQAENKEYMMQQYGS
ncbi:uncharacterized protein LOC118348031 [Juglans regia]|uniref:Uncharacterized protein LOC118348031 n=1 Tax=Juglans regia TaxID=51240 RepID=A0A6P9E8X6_JUGRE|nr:uncharacterized protein LOC118348031 [Juglans regia]